PDVDSLREVRRTRWNDDLVRVFGGTGITGDVDVGQQRLKTLVQTSKLDGVIRVKAVLNQQASDGPLKTSQSAGIAGDVCRRDAGQRHTRGEGRIGANRERRRYHVQGAVAGSVGGLIPGLQRVNRNPELSYHWQRIEHRALIRGREIINLGRKIKHHACCAALERRRGRLQVKRDVGLVARRTADVAVNRKRVECLGVLDLGDERRVQRRVVQIGANRKAEGHSARRRIVAAGADTKP